MTGVYSVPSIIRKGDWGVKLDITQAYYHVAMAARSRPYLRFIHNGKVYEFRVLTFGAHSSPFAFTRLGKTITLHCHTLGIRVVIYLDDVLILASTASLVASHAQIMIDLLVFLGMTIKVEKSILTPSQRIFFLGFIWDTENLSCVLPPEKLEDIQFAMNEAIVPRRVPVRLLHRLVGLINSTRLAVRYARSRYRGIQRLLLDNYKSKSDLQKEVRLTNWAKSDINFWLSLAPEQCAMTFEEVEIGLAIRVATDASDTGWGYVMLGQEHAGLWSPHEADLPIAFREFLVMEMALHDNKQILENKLVSWEVDNKTVFWYWKNQGGVGNTSLCRQVVNLLHWCQERNILVVAKWVPSEEHLHPDLLSRQEMMSDWKLHPRLAKMIFTRLGRPHLDLMATSYSAQLNLYYSPTPDSKALAVDAMVQNWDMFSKNYIFPPVPLIHPVLDKILTCASDTLFLLVTPYWKTRSWFPRLLLMSKSPPLRLPVRDVVQNTGKDERKLNLRLVVWNIFGAGSRPTTFPTGVEKSSTKAGRREQKELIPRPGASGPDIVTAAPWIQLTPLWHS